VSVEASSQPSVPTVRLSSFYFAYYAALGAFTPFWGLYLKARGQDVAAISILMSLWYATRIVAPSTWSWLAGRSTKPVRWLRSGCFATLASFAVFAVPLDFPTLFIAMCAFCFVYNAVMPQFEAITLSHLPGMTERYGRIRVWGSIGFIIVVSGFGIVFDHLSIEYLPWLMLPLFAGLLVSACNNDYAQVPDNTTTSGDTDFTSRLRQPQVIAFFIVALLMQLSFGPYYTFYSIYLDDHGYRASALGLFWSIGVILEIVLFAFSAKIFRRWSASTVLLSALIAASARWAILALWPQSFTLMAIAQMTHALSFAAFFAACMQFLANFFPGRLSGHGQGVFYGFSSGVGGVAGALLSGQICLHWNGETAFALAAFVAAVGVVIAWIWLTPTRASNSDRQTRHDQPERTAPAPASP
jgi:PPP family 3-phenylpropionic acid transporter